MLLYSLSLVESKVRLYWLISGHVTMAKTNVAPSVSNQRLPRPAGNSSYLFTLDSSYIMNRLIAGLLINRQFGFSLYPDVSLDFALENIEIFGKTKVPVFLETSN